MVSYKMKFYGRVHGRKSGVLYSVSKNQIIEAEEGEFNAEEAEKVDPKKEKVEKKAGAEEVETASVKPKSEKRKKK